MRRSMALVAVAAAMVVAGCGSDSGSGGSTGSSGSGDSGGAKATAIGLVLAGPKNDKSSNQTVAEGATAAATESGAKISISESVSPANAPQTLRQLAQGGHGIVVAMGAEFLQPVEQTAQAFPKTKFIVVYGGPSKVPNVLSVVADPHAMSYVAGTGAALMSKSGKLGIISGEDSDTFQEVVKGFTNGAKSIKPDIQVKHGFSGDYSDVAKNTEAARAFLDSGADVLLGYLDAGQAPMIKTAQGSGKFAIGYIAEMGDVGPKAVIVSAITDEGGIVKKVVLEAEKGTFQGGRQAAYGPKDGIGRLGTFGSFVPADVQAKIKETYDAIASGKIDPSQGG
jgi:basic membrane protein A